MLVVILHGSCVAPYTGAWIEIVLWYLLFRLVIVAPYTGAWIEMLKLGTLLVAEYSRSLYRSVD